MSYWEVYFAMLPFGLLAVFVLLGCALRAYLRDRRR